MALLLIAVSVLAVGTLQVGLALLLGEYRQGVSAIWPLGVGLIILYLRWRLYPDPTLADP